ncbi:MAG: hypothetical protein ACYSWP_07935 [Planctomycetota bacterium]|jgi:hypothetical protein
MKITFPLLAIRIIAALAICALTAMAFMRFANGAAMFCIDPPAADPGWRWKVPLAWATIYGVSTFLGIAVATIRSKATTTPIVVAFITIGTFIILRSMTFSPGYSYLNQTEAYGGIPAMLLAGVLACIVARLTKKTKLSDSGDRK